MVTRTYPVGGEIYHKSFYDSVALADKSQLIVPAHPSYKSLLLSLTISGRLKSTNPGKLITIFSNDGTPVGAYYEMTTAAGGDSEGLVPGVSYHFNIETTAINKRWTLVHGSGPICYDVHWCYVEA